MSALETALRPRRSFGPPASPGSMNVDWEERVDTDRLRTYRLGRAREALGRIGPRRAAPLRLQQHPLRHEHPHRRVGARQDDPLRAAHARRRAAPVGLRLGGQAPPPELPVAAAGEHPRRDDRPARRRGPDAGLFARRAREIADILRAEGVADMPVGVDIVEPPMLAALEAAGITVRDGQQTMLDAREVKSPDEIMLLNTACAMVDGAYQLITERLKPGVRESQLVADVTQGALRHGLASTSTTSTPSPASAARPHPARLQRPADPARRPGVLRHHPDLRRLQDLLLPHVRGRQRLATRSATRTSGRGEWIDASIELMTPGVSTDQVASVWPKARGVRVRHRDGVLRPAVRSRRRAVPARAADHQPPELARPSRSSSRRAWSSRSRRTARPRTATRRRGSRRRSW